MARCGKVRLTLRQGRTHWISAPSLRTSKCELRKALLTKHELIQPQTHALTFSPHCFIPCIFFHIQPLRRCLLCFPGSQQHRAIPRHASSAAEESPAKTLSRSLFLSICTRGWYRRVLAWILTGRCSAIIQQMVASRLCPVGQPQKTLSYRCGEVISRVKLTCLTIEKTSKLWTTERVKAMFDPGLPTKLAGHNQVLQRMTRMRLVLQITTGPGGP